VQKNAWGLHNPEFPEKPSSKAKRLKRILNPQITFLY